MTARRAQKQKPEPLLRDWNVYLFPTGAVAVELTRAQRQKSGMAGMNRAYNAMWRTLGFQDCDAVPPDLRSALSCIYHGLDEMEEALQRRGVWKR